MAQSPLMKSGATHTVTHLHAAGDVCPLCDQPIPHDRFDEIKERIESRELARSAEITARLQEQFAREKTEAVEQVRQEAAAALARETEEAVARVATARNEGRQAAEAAAHQQFMEAERANKDAQAAMQARIEEAEAAKTAAEQTGNALQAQLRRDNEAAIQKVIKDAAARESAVRQEAVTSAEAAMQEKISGAEQAKVEAEAKAAAADQQVRLLQETHEIQLAQRLHEQREVLERAQSEAVNAEKSAVFEEKLKLSIKVEELQRALNKKTAEELGEGAEIDLFEVLKAEFDGDRIERINKGQPGADILHVVIHNGKECGTIIYDSKNRNAWRKEFVTKLAADQMAAKADHAVLSTRKFPAGTRHLYVQDGVILAAPSRVGALVQIVRQHIVQTHTLRLSNEARAQKTAALYGFITSQRCSELFARIDTHTDDLLEMQVKEKKAHENMWKSQGELLRSVQKVRAEICNEIEAIIGTANTSEQAAYE